MRSVVLIARLAAAAFALSIASYGASAGPATVFAGCDDPDGAFKTCRINQAEVDRLAGKDAGAAFFKAWRLLSEAAGKTSPALEREVEDLLLSAADQDHPQATFMLAKQYLGQAQTGRNPTQMLELAVGYAERAVRLKVHGADGLALLALTNLAQQTSDRLTAQRAGSYLAKLSKAGDPFIDISVARKLARSEKPEDKVQLARVHVRLAASTPHLNSSLRVYQLLRQTLVPAKEAEYWSWLMIAAKSGLPAAMKEIGQRRASGELTPEEVTAAKAAADKWYAARFIEKQTGYAHVVAWCQAARPDDVTCAARSWRFFTHCGFPAGADPRYTRTVAFGQCLATRLDVLDKQIRQN